MAATESSPKLQALLLSALALPGLLPHTAQAAARDDDLFFALRASQYTEDAVPDSQLGSAEGDRYDIQVLQARFSAPVGRDFSVGTTLAYESMSGASPWFVEAGQDGKPVQVLSGATIEDKRRDAAIDLRWFGGRHQLALSAGISQEDDYRSLSGGLEWLLEMPDDHSTMNFGVGYSSDRIEPTEGGSTRFPNRPADESKSSVSAVVGFTTIIDAKSQWQLALSLTRLEGFLSDPYKLASVDDSLVQDARPDSRWQAALSTRYRHRFTGARASLHADYRYFLDEWEVNAHTVNLAWHQDLGDRFTLTPSVRYYSQSQAYFYQAYYRTARSDGLASSDYRLSPYGAYTLGLSLRYELGDAALTLAAERYDSEGKLAAGEVRVENPGLVDFTLVSFGVEYRY